MWKFLKALWRTLVAIKDLALILLLFGAGVLLVRLAVADAPKPFVPDKAALVVRIDGYVVEQYSATDPLQFINNNADKPGETRLRDIVGGIEAAARDSRIKAITLELDDFEGAGPADLQTIGTALKAFKATGKPVYAYAHYYTEPRFYLASLADEIWLHPMGGVVFRGYGDYQLYLKGALDKLAVTVNVFRVGRYKSFVEPYTRSDMSPDARDASRALLTTLWDLYRADVESARKAKGFKLAALTEGVQPLVLAAKGDLGQVALAARAVDRLGTAREFEARVIQTVGDGEDSEGLDSYAQIDLPSYVAATDPVENSAKPAVAVVQVYGDIVDGAAPAGAAGSATISEQIRKATQDEDVKAIVLRVNSPGGSVTASEEIRESLAAAQRNGKPVVASMGSVAASGGYWVASTSDEIWAEPATITGSIGVFGIIPSFQRSLEKIGVTSDGVGTTPLSDFGDLSRNMSEPAKLMVQSTIDNTYARFLTLVSDGRKQPVATVNELAQGRVWAGATFQQLKMVDHLGNLRQAIDAAARRAKLDHYGVRYFEPEAPWEERLLRTLFATAGLDQAKQARSGAAAPLLARLVGPAATLLRLDRLTREHKVQAVCLECLPFGGPAHMTMEDTAAARAMIGRLAGGI